MAIAIGGWRGYDGYEGFGLDSYGRGDLAHSIAMRDVFTRSVDDSLNIARKRAEVIKILTDAGGNLAQAALLAGYTEEEAMRIRGLEETLAYRLHGAKALPPMLKLRAAWRSRELGTPGGRAATRGHMRIG